MNNHVSDEPRGAARFLPLCGLLGALVMLAVVEMDSSDSPEKVAAFYRKALTKYGPVLDCSNSSPAKSPVGYDSSSHVLTCGDDKPEKGGILLKAGTQERQHLVSVQPARQGSFYQLVALGRWGAGD